MQHLLKYFKELTLHPKNAKELKGLILQLAVQGKLTAQWRKGNPDVEPASVLLEKITVAKAILIKEKKIKKEKPLPEILDEEIPYTMPESWEWCRLGTVTDIIAGASFKSGDFNEVGGAKCIKITNAGVRDFVETIGFLPKNFIEKYPNYLIKAGDLILALTRPYIKAGLKISICPGSYNNSLLNQRVAAIRSMTEELYHPYVFTFIQSPHILDYYKSKFDAKSQQPNMKMGDITDLLFAVPPLKEQQAIMAIVNQLFAEVGQLEVLTKQRIQLKEDFVTSALRQLSTEDTTRAWTFLLPHFKSFFTEKSSVKKLRESIIQLAAKGKLTKDWREQNKLSGVEVEDSSVLLERIKTEKAQLILDKKIRKEKPLPVITKDEIPYELPEGWVWCISQTLFRYEQGIQVDKNLQLTSPAQGYKRFLRIVDFTQNTDDLRYVPNPGEKYLVSSDNLVMVRYGASAGFIGSELSGVLANNLFKIHYDNLNKEFVKLIFQSPYFVQELKLNAKGGAMPAINFSFLNKFLFPLAPLEEQKVIVRQVRVLLALCDTLEKEIETHQTTQEHWMQSCLKEVFEGEIREPNLKCTSCDYTAISDCLGFRGSYCAPAVCKLCNNIYDINTEFCGEPEEINKCNHCGGYDYEEWDQEEMSCPKCNQRMEVLKELC